MSLNDKIEGGLFQNFGKKSLIFRFYFSSFLVFRRSNGIDEFSCSQYFQKVSLCLFLFFSGKFKKTEKILIKYINTF